MEDIVLVGFGGHAKSVADSIKRQGRYTIIGYTDNEEHECCQYDYLGNDSVLEQLYDQGVHNAAICIGYLGKGLIRERIYRKLKSFGYEFPVIIDPSAIVSINATIGEGTFIGKMAIINANAKIGRMAIINTKALVEHDCEVEEFTHIAVGTVLCGAVIVGRKSFIGANATILQSIQIGYNSIIGAGAVVSKSIPNKCVAVGNPAKTIKVLE